MPVILSQINDDWHKHWEGLFLVGLQDVEEVVIFEEAHGSVSDLQVDTANALYDSLEELRDQMLDFVDFTNFEDLLQLGQEQRLLDAVGEWPELEQAFQKRNSQSSILGQEEHRASQELLVERRAGLHFVEWDDDILEEDHVLVTERYGEAADDTCQDIEELGGTIELVVFMDKCIKAFIH